MPDDGRRRPRRALHAGLARADRDRGRASCSRTGKYSVKFLDVDGNEIGKRGINLNDAVPLEEIPDHMIKATMATEDRRFYEHFGVDFSALRAR